MTIGFIPQTVCLITHRRHAIRSVAPISISLCLMRHLRYYPRHLQYAHQYPEFLTAEKKLSSRQEKRLCTVSEKGATIGTYLCE